MTKVRDAFLEGYKTGWIKCRDFICQEFNLDKEELIKHERFDKFSEELPKKKGCRKEINPYKNIKFPCGDIAGGKEYYCDECEEKIYASSKSPKTKHKPGKNKNVEEIRE